MNEPIKTAEAYYEDAFYDPHYDAKHRNINMKQRVVGIMEQYVSQQTAELQSEVESQKK